MLRSNSLAWRIFFASIILMPLLLVFSAFMLDRAFRDSLHLTEKDTLLAYTYSMMGLAEPDDGFLLLPENLTEPRFNDPDSGLYAQVVDEEFGPIWESISLSISPLTGKVPTEKVEMGVFHFFVVKVAGEDFFLSRFNTVWEIDGQDREYQFVVMHSQKQIKDEVNGYRGALAAWLGGLALLLILIQTLIIRWGLFPLKRLAQDIKHLEAGSIESLDHNYPAEIVPVTHNINLLLNSEKSQRKRYKNTLGDLAHSLKTPLSVIRSVLEKQVSKATQQQDWHQSIDEQVERMANIISHQLNRAVTSKASYLTKLPIKPIFNRIGVALSKVYQEKNIHFECHIDEKVEYPAQEDDLMEICGNLLENAFKYGKQQVRVKALDEEKLVRITIEDDGPGVPENMRAEILKRGSRGDTSAPGQGIGLAVAVDILSSYDAGVEVSRSDLGGAQFTIMLPK